MAAPSSGSAPPASPRTGVIRVLVGALADDSAEVREAASSALQENARWNSRTVLDCCITSLRTVRRRAGQQSSYQARVFRVMAHTVREMDEQELDAGAMRKIAKLALMEMTSSKDVNMVWQRAASGLLVAIGSRYPDLMMEEIFLQLTGSVVSASAVVQTLAEFASLEASLFTPRVKGVFSRVLPLLGCVKDSQRAVFASAFKQWCWAITQYYDDFPSAPRLDADTIAFLHSAFELFLGSWVMAREPKIRLATIEVLGEMVPIVSEYQRKTALPRLLPVILGMYKKDRDNPLPVTRSLHALLDAVLKPNVGTMLLDFQGVIAIMNTLLPMASTYLKSRVSLKSSVVLRNSNEVLRCFMTIGSAFSDDLFTYLISRVGNKDDSVRLGVFSVLQHLLPRLCEDWNNRRSELLDAIKPSLLEQDFFIRKALVELILSMASRGWVEKGSGEIFVEFIVKQCAIGEYPAKHETETEASKREIENKSGDIFKTELKLGTVSPLELRTMCDKAMLLLAGTMPEMEVVLWPYLLKLTIISDYTGAVPTICRCITEIARRKLWGGSSLEIYASFPNDIPKPEEVLARLLVLLQNPLGKQQPALQILTALYYLGDLFPKSVALLWEDEIPKLKTYVDDPEDLKAESWQQSTWDDMIIHLLAESLDVSQSTEWTSSLGNAFSDQYDLYIDDHAHCALLHRCLGVLLQRIDNRFYVREKLEVMFRKAVVSNLSNRLGLAMGFGLVAAAHLDTVLEKLKRILESQSRNTFQRFFSIFTDQKNRTAVDDVYAALALMYGYAASYAPSSVIEARIDALVGTNMLSGLLDVRTATARQAVITAIDLLGQSVMRASVHGTPFPLKKRDELLSYILKLMAAEDGNANPELLDTQILALNACTTLVSVEPKLTIAGRDVILQATLNFFSLPHEPKLVIESLIIKLIRLLRAILLTSGDDGKSRADQLLHLLKSLDHYASSSVGHQRSRACTAVLDLLSEFRALCVTGTSSLGFNGPFVHLRAPSNRLQRSPETAGVLLLPSRESLNLGERLMVYLPRCADTVPSIPKCAAQIIDLLFSIALLLPHPVGSLTNGDKHSSYSALSKLEDLIAINKWGVENDNHEIFTQIVEYVGYLLTSQELVTALRGCVSAICDKTHSSAKATVGAVIQLIQSRGQDLREADIERVTQSLISSAGMVGDSIIRCEALNGVCALAEYTEDKLVFDALMTSAERDITTKDVTRLKVWPVQDAFHALAQHEHLSITFLDYVVEILSEFPVLKDEAEHTDSSDQASHAHYRNQMQQAALVALATFLRKEAVGKRAVEQRYASVICSFFLQFGTYHGISLVDVQPLRNIIRTFQDFCDCVGEKAMKKILVQDGEQIIAGERWTLSISRIASCVCDTRPKEVEKICARLWITLKRTFDSHRAIAAAVLSEYVHSCKDSFLLSQLVSALSAQIGDDSWVVRQLCVKGLVEIPKEQMPDYTSQVLRVIIALIEDIEEEVAATVVEGLIVVLEDVTEETIAPVLLNLCGRLRTLQLRRNVRIRAASFGALGILTKFGAVQGEAFMEQIQATLPRVIFHIHDEAPIVRQTCKNTLKKMLSYLEMESLLDLTNSRVFVSDHRSDYEIFLKDLARNLVQSQMERMDSYVTTAIQNFDSSWPDIQANAAFFTGCLLSQLVDHKILTIHLPQVVGSLVRMTANSPSSVVRSTSAKALSILLNSIH